MEYSILDKISFYACFVALISALINIRRIKGIFVPLFIYLVAAAITEILANLHVQSGSNNFYLFRLFTIIEFTLLSVFYIGFFKKFFKTYFFYCVLPLFYMVSFFDYKQNGADTLDDFSVSFESLIFSCYSLFLFYFVLKNLIFEDLLGSSIFWINTGVLLYFSGNLLLFTFNRFLFFDHPYEHIVLWSTIHSFFNITFNVLLSVSFWKSGIA
jgi:hypothetical protein